MIDHNTPQPSENPDPDALEEAVATYIDRLTDGEQLDDMQILMENPGIGHEILERLERFIEIAGVRSGSSPLGTLGDYTLRRQIGRGGMGVVYEAWENSMDRRVALKVLPAGIAADTRASARFLREAQTAGKLSHPNVVPVYFTGVKEQTPFYAMEYVEGETLAKVLARVKDAELDRDTPFGKKDDTRYFANIAEAFADVADGLQHAHSKGVIHRDIKPSNLILDQDGRLRILDFGLARLEGHESLTISGDVVGTPLYMSPEQARRRAIPIDHRTDVYSLGATMYEALTGQPPFRGKDHADTLSQIIERDPRSPLQLNSRIPADLETIILKCLRKDADDRYGTAEALAQDLRRFVRGDAIEARPPSTWDRSRRHVTRYRLRYASCLLAVLGILAISALEVSRRADLRESELLSYRKNVRGAAAKVLASALILDRGFAGARPLVRWDRDPWKAEDFQNLDQTDSRTPLEQAIDVLASESQSLPDQPDACFWLARALRLVGQKDRAVREVKAALRRDSDFLPAKLLEVNLLYAEKAAKRREFDQIARQFDDPDGWESHYIRAARALQDRDWFDAAEAFESLDRVMSAFDREHYVGFFLEVSIRRGVSHLEAGQYEDSKRAFHHAEVYSRGLIEPRVFVAKAHYREGDVKRAEQELETLFRTGDPRQKNSIANWNALVFHSLCDFRRAREWAQEIEDSTLSDRLSMYFSYRMGELKRAVDVGRRLRASDSPDPVALSVLALALFDQLEQLDEADRSGRLDEVIEIAGQALGFDDTLKLARKVLELAREARGRLTAPPRATTLAQMGFFSSPRRLEGAGARHLKEGPVISRNGLELFYSSYDAPGAGGDYDIFVRTRSSIRHPFGEAKPLSSANTEFEDFALWISGDGKTLYISSTRRGSANWDIWELRRPRLGAPFETERNLTKLNSPYLDGYGLSITDDDLEMYFDRSLERYGGELFVAWRASPDEPWGSNVVRLWELNRPVYSDVSPSISPDGLTLIYNASSREGGFGGHDLWIATRPERFDDEGNRVPFREPVNVGPQTNSGRTEWQAKLSRQWPARDSILYFASGIRGQNMDIYAASWHPDCNGNGVDDLDDIVNGNADDANANDIPDECESPF